MVGLETLQDVERSAQGISVNKYDQELAKRLTCMNRKAVTAVLNG